MGGGDHFSSLGLVVFWCNRPTRACLVLKQDWRYTKIIFVEREAAAYLSAVILKLFDVCERCNAIG